ncbi:MAG: 16S rRNA (guanine(966)-N(2))-methyltransferase RsmD [bacterium]
MKIISGTRKGVSLSAIRNSFLRPTTNRTKELIFNVVSDCLEDSVILDVYAGSGSLGIEALSRGAAKAIFIENNRYALKVLRKNLEKTGFIDKAHILRDSADIAIKKLAKLAVKFDLIFADPPYIKNLAWRTVKAVEKSNLLQKGGLLIVEHSCRAELKYTADKLILKFCKRMGDSSVSFFQYVEKE